jgi:hypothetical protein
MKMTKFLVMALLVAGVAQTVHADSDTEDCEMPRANRLVVLALHDALQNVNFPDCRIEIKDAGVSLEHGAEHGWVNFFRRRTEVDLSKGNVVISGYKRAEDDEIAWYQDKFNFILSADQKTIVEVDYAQYVVNQVNTGTIVQPVYKPVKTRINTIVCKTY